MAGLRSTAKCPRCGTTRAVNGQLRIWRHGAGESACPGSGQPVPIEDIRPAGPPRPTHQLEGVTVS